MSLDLTVYARNISDNHLPEIVKRLNDFEMECEVHPNISFSNHSGFLPFKFRLRNPPFPVLKDKQLISGFELYTDNFNLTIEKEKLRPKQNVFDKLLGKKYPKVQFAPTDVEERIKDCKKVVSFVWHAADSFELRFASLTSAIFTELTDGVCCYTSDDIWYDNQNFVMKTWQEIKEYETTHLKERDLKYHVFESWD